MWGWMGSDIVVWWVLGEGCWGVGLVFSVVVLRFIKFVVGVVLVVMF